MFTGLIIEMGEISSIQKKSGGAVLSLKAEKIASDAAIGDSISVNGTCLTVVEKKNTMLSFDLSQETLQSTNVGTLKPGDRVNLETSLTASSKIGGHFVTGHVDVAAVIRSRANIGDMLKFEIALPADAMKFIVAKGSVAVDGISLTVVDVLKDGFTVVIIPHTAKLTTLGYKGAGDTVNIELDILGKYVSRFLGRDNESKDARFMDTLTREGFAGR